MEEEIVDEAVEARYKALKCHWRSGISRKLDIRNNYQGNTLLKICTKMFSYGHFN